MNRFLVLVVVSSLSLIRESSAQGVTPVSVDRPPQFVLLAYDGSKSINSWKNTRAHAAKMTAEGKPLRFTYFISGVYFLHSTNNKLYNAPVKGVGASAIGFGKSSADIGQRIDQLNAAFSEDHEIASHANGHFNGNAWTEEYWQSEFSQFTSLIFDAPKNNGLSKTLKFAPSDIVGFRAPELSNSKGLWPTLKAHQFRYDTSLVNDVSYWPEKNFYGTWNFPLARVKIVGSGKWTLSMDYNFYVAQSKGVDDLPNAPLYEKEMLDTYLAYFKGNYHGNRAPVHIGHHFSPFNGGAYERALRRFSAAVCGLPEVRCVTYKELVAFMEATDEKTRLAYQAGKFPKFSPELGGSSFFHSPTIENNSKPFVQMTEQGVHAIPPMVGDEPGLQRHFQHKVSPEALLFDEEDDHHSH